MSHWKPIYTAPRDRMIVFAVKVHSSEGDEFIRWDTWTDDPSGDWSDEREIGWAMIEASFWTECPPEE